METILILSQIIFYLVVSAAIIILGILFGVATHHLIRITKELEAISINFRDMSDDADERIREIIERLARLPILSFFLRNRGTEGGEHKKKGRRTSYTKQQ
jgi:hypothetical protein